MPKRKSLIRQRASACEMYVHPKIGLENRGETFRPRPVTIAPIALVFPFPGGPCSRWPHRYGRLGYLRFLRDKKRFWHSAGMETLFRVNRTVGRKPVAVLS